MIGFLLSCVRPISQVAFCVTFEFEKLNSRQVAPNGVRAVSSLPASAAAANVSAARCASHRSIVLTSCGPWAAGCVLLFAVGIQPANVRNLLHTFREIHTADRVASGLVIERNVWPPDFFDDK